MSATLLIVYHGKCPDGMTSAASMLHGLAAGGASSSAEARKALCGREHGADFVAECVAALASAGAESGAVEVYFLDVCVGAEDVAALATKLGPDRALSVQAIVDHHKGNAGYINSVLAAHPKCVARVDSTVAIDEAHASRVTVHAGKVSAALLSWEHFHDSASEPPVWVRGVSANDTWSFTEAWPQRLCNALYLQLPKTVEGMLERLRDAAWPDMDALASAAGIVETVQLTHGDAIIEPRHVVDLSWCTLSDTDATPVRAAFIPGARADTSAGCRAALANRDMDPVHVFVFFHYDAISDEWKVSLRGRGAVDLTRVADAAKATFPGVVGGGHAGAAGLSFSAFHIRDMWGAGGAKGGAGGAGDKG